MAIPALTALPIPPLATDSEAVFNTKADASLLAEKNFVDEMNASTIPGINQAVTDTAAAKNAAAASATAAAGSADAAAGSISAAAHQVDLATAQASNAAASANSAQIYAAAAGSAAGAPSIAGHDAFDVLQINSGKTGVQWGKAGQSVGDILVTARNPGSTYAQANRVSYLQSAYPDLYALIGTTPDTDRSTITSSVMAGATGAGDSVTAMATSGSLTIAVSSTTLFYYTSTDNGVTWTRRSAPWGVNAQAIAAQNGLFIVTLQQNGAPAYKSTDGVTWINFSLTITFNVPAIYVVGGLFVVFNTATANYVTSPDGVAWTARSMGSTPTTQIGTVVNGVLVLLNSSYSYYFFTPDGINWSFAYPKLADNTVLYLTTMTYKAGIYYASAIGADGSLYTTTGPLLSAQIWTKIPNAFTFADGTHPNISFAGASANNECIVFTSITGPSIWISNDLGATWVYRASPFSGYKPYTFPAKFLFVANNTISAMPYYSYDPTTYFITPKVNAQPAPLTTYIKGKLV